MFESRSGVCWQGKKAPDWHTLATTTQTSEALPSIKYQRRRSLQKVYFLAPPAASKHSAFSLNKVSGSEVTTFLQKFVSKKRLRRPPFWTVLGSQTVFMWRNYVRLEIGEKRTKTCNWIGILHKVSKFIFSYWLSTSLSSMLLIRSLEHVWFKIIKVKSSHNPEW